MIYTKALSFRPNHVPNIVEQLCVEGRCETDGGGEDGAIIGEAVQTCEKIRSKEGGFEVSRSRYTPSDWMSAGIPNVVFSIRNFCPTVMA